MTGMEASAQTCTFPKAFQYHFSFSLSISLIFLKDKHNLVSADNKPNQMLESGCHHAFVEVSTETMQLLIINI